MRRVLWDRKVVVVIATAGWVAFSVYSGRILNRFRESNLSRNKNIAGFYFLLSTFSQHAKMKTIKTKWDSTG